MRELVRKLRSLKKTVPGGAFFLDRPVVLFQSDDWGRVGVRDQEGYEQLRAAKIPLGQNPYDFYTLETPEDLAALADMLQRHHDSTGRSPCLVMNFLTANLDFKKMAECGFEKIYLLPLAKGLPGSWKRPGLLEAYRRGISAGVFYPALHGLTHFCQPAIEHSLAHDAERRELLHTLWKAETPYIYWRMPWVGYEYYNPEKPQPGFLAAATQESLIRLAAEGFARLFSTFPTSACAPGYRANRHTHQAWTKWGVKVAQNGSGAPLPPSLDEFEILQLHRTIDVEPSQKDLPVEKYLELAADCFARGVPAVVSVHSINFHSSLKNYRDPSLQALDQFLSALESKYPNLLYAHDGDMYKIVTQGRFDAGHGTILVNVKQQGKRNVRSGAEDPAS